jgi:hypothetical protein
MSEMKAVSARGLALIGIENIVEIEESKGKLCIPEQGKSWEDDIRFKIDMEGLTFYEAFLSVRNRLLGVAQ